MPTTKLRDHIIHSPQHFNGDLMKWGAAVVRMRSELERQHIRVNTVLVDERMCMCPHFRTNTNQQGVPRMKNDFAQEFGDFLEREFPGVFAEDDDELIANEYGLKVNQHGVPLPLRLSSTAAERNAALQAADKIRSNRRNDEVLRDAERRRATGDEPPAPPKWMTRSGPLPSTRELQDEQE